MRETLVMNKLTQEEMKTLFQTTNKMGLNNPLWRRGQCIFNALYILYPEVAEEIRATAMDPFYQDSRIAACINHITKDEG